MKKIKKRVIGVLLAFMQLTASVAAMPTVRAVSQGVDYPSELIHISTMDNSKNLDISGTADKSSLNTEISDGEQNENWRFDYVGTNSKGSYYKIINQGTGRAIVPMGYNAAEGTEAVIFGSENETAQCWYVTAVEQDSYGNDIVSRGQAISQRQIK